MFTALVTVAVLFSCKNNENSTTRPYPVGAYTLGMVDLSEKGTFCLSPDDNQLVTGRIYSVGSVELPEWLSADEWASNFVKWKYLWGHGVEPTWPESWQRGMLRMPSAEKEGCVKLLKTKNFRSSFRSSLRDQLVDWLEAPAEDRVYPTPFSPRQWECVIDQWTVLRAKRTAAQLYAVR